MNASFFGRSRWVAALAVLALLAGGLALRLINLDNPPLDLHAWRQLRGASIARGMYYTWLPSVDPAVREQARFLAGSFQHQEPRISETIVALAYLLTGSEKLWLARLYSILLWMSGGLALFLLARRMVSTDGAMIGLAYYLFLPYSVSHSRLFMPDIPMCAGILAGLWAAYRWTRVYTWKWAMLAGLFSGLAILIKVFAVFFLFPPILFLILSFKGLKATREAQAWAMFVLMAAIPAAYYLLLPGGGGADNYLATWSEPFRLLLTDINFYIGWFHKLGQFNLTLVVLALMSLPMLPAPGRGMMFGLWLGYLLFGLMLPAPIRSHSYYSLPLVFIVALSLVPLADLVLARIARLHLAWQWLFLAAALVGLGDSALMARKEVTGADYRQEPAFWLELGKQLPTEGKYIGLSEDYNTRLQYYGWRFMREYTYATDYDMGRLSGHAFNQLTLDEENWRFFLGKTQGYRYFLVTVLDEFEAQPYLKEILYGYYPVVMSGERYVLFDLAHPRKEIPVSPP